MTGLGRGLSAALARWRAPRAAHDPGKIIADLAASVARGRDCRADIAVLREQPGLAGPVPSDPAVSRLVTALAADAPRALKAIRAARAAARERAWALAGTLRPAACGSSPSPGASSVAGAVCGCAWPNAGHGLARSPQRPPGCRHSLGANQPEPPQQPGRKPARARGTPPTRRDSRAPRHSPALKTATGRCLRPPGQGRERLRLRSGKWGYARH